jgi:hypothetical protein
MLAERWFPDRCREIPEAVNPDRIVLRQVALWSRHVYLQQFSSSEDSGWLHSHQFYWCIAIGLWGSYWEFRQAGKVRVHRAPYFYMMDERVVHQVLFPSKGHTSIFIGLWRDDDLKVYLPADQDVPWEEHIQVKVKRI